MHAFLYRFWLLYRQTCSMIRASKSHESKCPYYYVCRRFPSYAPNVITWKMFCCVWSGVSGNFWTAFVQNNLPFLWSWITQSQLNCYCYFSLTSSFIWHSLRYFYFFSCFLSLHEKPYCSLERVLFVVSDDSVLMSTQIWKTHRRGATKIRARSVALASKMSVDSCCWCPSLM